MKHHFVRGVGLALALASLTLVSEAQKRRPGGGDPPPSGGHCHGAGIRCWFGRAAPCQVTCTTGLAKCIGASCILGFPVPAECFCEFGNPT